VLDKYAAPLRAPPFDSRLSEQKDMHAAGSQAPDIGETVFSRRQVRQSNTATAGKTTLFGDIHKHSFVDSG
jgi:hypothetical protein